MMETLSDLEIGRGGCVCCVYWAFRESQGDHVQKTESLIEDIDFLDFGGMDLDTGRCGFQSGSALAGKGLGLPHSVRVHETKRDKVSETVHRDDTPANAAMGLQQ
jgi:hypothetical protein